ncbi:MAG: alpha-amylase family glycosyl hydrolase [Anaerolineales bacterium]
MSFLSPKALPKRMDDFIFGTLATEEARLNHVRAQRAGVTHYHARIPRHPRPGQPITLELSVGPAYPCRQAWVYWTNDGSDPEGEQGKAIRGHVTPMEGAAVEWDTLLWGYVRRFRAVIPAQPSETVLRYRLAVSTDEGREVLADQGAFYACYIADDSPPAWAQDAIVYHIFVDRFSPADGDGWRKPARPSGFYGGTLRGVTEKMDYLAQLGVNALWLSPIFPSPTHHGYDATDYFEIEPRLGSKADLRALLDAAHARGIRVLLDFVPNHCSHLHPAFQQAIADPHSPYRDWFTFHSWPKDYRTFFGVRSMPQINLRHPAARQHILDAAVYWLEFGVDGYRLDYASGPTPDFWADFRRATRKARSDCWTFGEVVDPPDFQLAFEGLLDGCLDFLLLEAFRQAFAFARWNAAQFASFLDRHEAFFPPMFSRPSFLDNHDMNRFLWAAQGDRRRLKLAALCQFTLAGTPIIYYGTEVGLSQKRDVRQGRRGVPEEARLPMLWGEAQDTDLLSFYRQLIALRRREAALRRGARQTLYADADLLAYARSLEGETVLVGMNMGQEPRRLTLPGRWGSLAFASDPACKVSIHGESTQVDLPPLSGIILK